MAEGKKALIMEEKAIQRSLTRMTHEILERNKGTQDLVLVGIKRRGDFLAKRIAKFIQETEGIKVPLGAVDITFHRDDLSSVAHQPVVHKTEIPFDVTDKTVILVDDVLYTGRTVRAAIDEIIDFGRPRKIELAVLIDRGHRELPIRADYVGKSLQTSKKESVVVKIKEEDGEDRITIENSNIKNQKLNL
ncbi:MAG: bifunctional pyr operon transcriptional regulator/uracil phosphoribosyltransferase PyrR [Candidatus Edwardsbacteria bacterium]